MEGKILVVSDSHDSPDLLQKAVDRESPFNALVFCGDGIRDTARIKLPHGVTVYRVKGNTDRGCPIDAKTVVFPVIFGKKVMITHGDHYGVKKDNLALLKEARSKSCEVVLFGHTHNQLLENTPGIVLFNPGPLQFGHYGTIEISNGEWSFKHMGI